MNKLNFNFFLILTIVSGCTNQFNNVQHSLDYSVINYSKDYFSNVRLNNEGIANVDGVKFLGSFESSGQYCCISINKNYPPIVEYVIANDNGSDIFKQKNAEFIDINAEGSNVILHILPNETFLIEFTNELPDPSEKILDDYLKENKIIRQDLDSPSNWRLKN